MPKWSSGHSDPHLGPLANVTGCEKVWLGKMVEDPEQAVLIACKYSQLSSKRIYPLTSTSVWESADAVTEFQQSAACGELLLDLGYATGCSSQLISLQDGRGGFGLGDRLHGRVTLTTLRNLYIGIAELQAGRHAIYTAFHRFLPVGFKTGRHGRSSLTHRGSFSFNWVDDSEQERTTTAETASGEDVCYLFVRWNGNGSRPEWEDAAVRDPKSKERWAKTVAKARHVTAWNQER